MTAAGVVSNCVVRGGRSGCCTSLKADVFGGGNIYVTAGTITHCIVSNGCFNGSYSALMSPLEAIACAKRCACPPNCRRLSKKTPCAEMGYCADCDSSDRICKVTAFFDRAPTRTPTKVILVDEDLGY